MGGKDSDNVYRLHFQVFWPFLFYFLERGADIFPIKMACLLKKITLPKAYVIWVKGNEKTPGSFLFHVREEEKG